MRERQEGEEERQEMEKIKEFRKSKNSSNPKEECGKTQEEIEKDILDMNIKVNKQCDSRHHQE